ncbi:MAG: hypothetical protein IV090_26760 [Candidatus Sericytochromatia bacterium]|jgi:hypothetical protein|nr:hypothetical protein [Candidatus Sericytochromatia bacterium]
MEIDLATCTEEDLWRYVASHLAREGIETILVGGAVVSIYSEGAYRSGDLDLVLGSMFVKNLDQAMQKIGFKKNGRHFEHPECKHLFVEFPGSPPLGIGSDYTIKPDELTVDSHIIKILSPTDCVKDRLASFIYFNDREGLEQALLVAKRQMIDLKSIQKWCKAEGHPEAYQIFSEKLESAK